MEDRRVQIIDKIFEKTINLKQIHECVLYIENTNGDFSYKNGYGGKDINTPFLIASITKLFTTTCILGLMEKNLISLDDKVSNYFSEDVMSGLHMYDGKEYSYDLTISNLLFQTSGLPNSYEEGHNSIKKILIGNDIYFDFIQDIELVKKLNPHFVPGTSNKAYYADINFDMLGLSGNVYII